MIDAARRELDAQQLADMLANWRREGELTQAVAARMLGLSRRTYEGIEAGRGFRYPLLLTLALQSFR